MDIFALHSLLVTGQPQRGKRIFSLDFGPTVVQDEGSEFPSQEEGSTRGDAPWPPTLAPFCKRPTSARPCRPLPTFPAAAATAQVAAAVLAAARRHRCNWPCPDPTAPIHPGMVACPQPPRETLPSISSPPPLPPHASVSWSPCWPPSSFHTGHCRPRLAGHAGTDPQCPGQLEPPAATPAQARLLLTWSSAGPNPGPLAPGFDLPYRRQASGNQVTAGLEGGPVYNYGAADASNYLAPPPEAANALHAESDGSRTETQPDGTQFRYSTPGQLRYVRNPSGGRWTVIHDSSGRVQAVADPLGGRVTLAYGGVRNLLTSLSDAAGRRTTLTTLTGPGGSARGSRLPTATA